MNAVPRTISPLARFGWQLRREYWENRGGFLWAPMLAGVAWLLLCALTFIGTLVFGRSATGNVNVMGGDSVITLDGLDLGQLATRLAAEDLAQLGQGLNVALAVSAAWPLLVLAFVVFFYCLGALYDDRRDRSILFWKSLPLSDTSSVAAKLVAALVVAPLIALLAAAATMTGFLLLLSATVAFLGGNPWTLVLQPANPLMLLASLAAWLPVYLLWALPTAGWLLMCSARARRLPFLWAVLVPVLGGALVALSGLGRTIGLDTGTLWSGIARLLLGTLPGIDTAWHASPASEILTRPSPLYALQSLGLPSLWIGALVGLAFIAVAIAVRRRSDDS